MPIILFLFQRQCMNVFEADIKEWRSRSTPLFVNVAFVLLHGVGASVVIVEIFLGWTIPSSTYNSPTPISPLIHPL
jgi:hypothetical protein